MVRSAQEQLQFTLLNRILSLLESEQLDALRELILEAHPADIAQMIGAIPREERETVLAIGPRFHQWRHPTRFGQRCPCGVTGWLRN